MNGKLTLKNMTFYANHGVYDLEKELGQKWEVDVELVTDFSGAVNDDFTQALNYVEVYDLVKHIMTKQQFNLVEGLATKILIEITSHFNPKILTVRVRKVQPPVGGLIDSVEFETTYQQS